MLEKYNPAQLKELAHNARNLVDSARRIIDEVEKAKSSPEYEALMKKCPTLASALKELGGWINKTKSSIK